MARPKRVNRREAAYRKRALSRKVKHHEVRIVSRKEQPSILRGKTESIRGPSGQILITPLRKVKALKDIKGTGGPVSSSWIASLYWNGSYALMHLIEGHLYEVYIPFKTFEEWYYSHSKGTYFNYLIKDKFKVVRTL